MVASVDDKKVVVEAKVEGNSPSDKISKAGVGESVSAITPEQKPASTGLRGFFEGLPVIGPLIKRFLNFIISLFSSSSPAVTKKKPTEGSQGSTEDSKSTDAEQEQVSKEIREEHRATTIGQADQEFRDASNALDKLAPWPYKWKDLTHDKQPDLQSQLRGRYRDRLVNRDSKREEALKNIRGLTKELCTEVEQAIDRKKKAILLKNVVQAELELNKLAPLSSTWKSLKEQPDDETKLMGLYREKLSGDPTKRDFERKEALVIIAGLTEALCNRVDQAIDKKNKATQELEKKEAKLKAAKK